jgi:hypothetical protein
MQSRAYLELQIAMDMANMFKFDEIHKETKGIPLQLANKSNCMRRIEDGECKST